MLGLRGGRVECVWEEVLRERLRELPDGLARIDALLRDEALVFAARAALGAGGGAAWPFREGAWRPTIALQTYARLVALEHRWGWG